MVTPVAISSIGYRYYIVYICIGICVPSVVYLYYPESMGRSLEEMDLLFRESVSVRAVVRASLKAPGRFIEEDSKIADKGGAEVERIESRRL